MSARQSINWRRTAQAALRLSLHGTGWLLTHGGRLLQSSGKLLNTISRSLNPVPPDPRRK